MAIISASRRTDIPFFFPEWFMERIRAGFFHRLNPFNARQVRRVSLLPADVNAIVFWTKNPRPLLAYLPELDSRGYCYYFQYTLNPYDGRFEPNLAPLEERIETFRRLSRQIGASRVVWRYDPIILSNVTPPEFHVENIDRIAAALYGFTGRIMVSFFDPYPKLKGRLRELERRHGIAIRDTTGGDELRFLGELARIAALNGMEIFSCAEERDFSAMGIGHGSCVDGELIATLSGSAVRFARDRRQRKACGCAESIDMGMYDTCRSGCVYCYANRSEKCVEITLAKHDRRSASIIGT